MNRLPMKISLPVALMLSACASMNPQKPVPLPAAEPGDGFPAPAPQAEDVGVTIIGGEQPMPAQPAVAKSAVRAGDIRFNFPSADVNVVAKAVLGDVLRVPFNVAPGISTPVTLVTPGAISRSSVLQVFEDALRAAGLALVPQGGGFTITTVGNAQASGPTGPTTIGYGSELLRLQFINAVELKKLLDSVIPGVVSGIDEGSNSVTVAGTAGQRTSARDLIRQFDVNWLRNMSFAYFVPQKTDARLIVPELDKLINAPDSPTRSLVRLIAMERLNGIIAVSTQRQYLEDVRRWIDVLDREGAGNDPRLFVYRVQNGRSRDLAKTINTAFGNSSSGSGSGDSTDPFETSAGASRDGATGTGASDKREPVKSDTGDSDVRQGQNGGSGRRGPDVSISSDDNNNAVIVYGTPREFAVVEEALRKLDVPPVQVMIEAAITEVSLTDDLRFGVQWNFQTGNSNFALTEGTSANPTRRFPGFSYFLSSNDIMGTLNALEERTNVKVMSAPKLMVLNNQTASLQVGDQVPIQTQSSQSTDSGNSPIINAIEYRDTGVLLKVTPRVNAGGLVLLDIAQEVSDVKTTTTSGIESPTIATRRVSTSIAVQDGQVIALGGLFRDSRSFGKNGLPILSRIPILGGLLFGNDRNTQNRTELIVLLKPHVIRTADDARAVTEELRSKLRTLEPFRTEGRIP